MGGGNWEGELELDSDPGVRGGGGGRRTRPASSLPPPSSQGRLPSPSPLPLAATPAHSAPSFRLGPLLLLTLPRLPAGLPHREAPRHKGNGLHGRTAPPLPRETANMAASHLRLPSMPRAAPRCLAAHHRGEETLCLRHVHAPDVGSAALEPEFPVGRSRP